MTAFRVTVGSQAASSINSIRSASNELARLQAELSSGKRIQTPSDDPVGTVSALKLHSSISRNDQYAANSRDALAWLSAADSAYGQLVDAAQQARTAVNKGLNSGANDADSYRALASEIDGVRKTMLSLANTEYNGRPVFGGTTAAGAAYDSSGNYVGDTGSVTRAIAPDSQVTVSAQGPDVFGAGAENVFGLLSNISDQLKSDPSSLSDSLTKLDSAIARLSSAQAGEGATYSRVQRAQTEQTAQGNAMTTSLSDIEDTDFAEMAVKVTSANTAYQAALQTTANVRQLSLLDFLR